MGDLASAVTALAVMSIYQCTVKISAGIRCRIQSYDKQHYSKLSVKINHYLCKKVFFSDAIWAYIEILCFRSEAIIEIKKSFVKLLFVE